jgi:hypothetical protein
MSRQAIPPAAERLGPRETSPGQQAAATRTVLRHAVSEEDADQLLYEIGLLPDPLALKRNPKAPHKVAADQARKDQP